MKNFKIFLNILGLNHKNKDWKVFINNKRLDPVLKEMIISYEAKRKRFMTSKYWNELNYKNVSQLLEHGYENFKQTVALNYFTWLLDENQPQVEFLKKSLSKLKIERLKKRSKNYQKHLLFSKDQSEFFNFVTLMLWEYFKKQNIKKVLSEPLIGNPPAIKINNKLISQDLINSILEYQSISEGVGSFKKNKTILEIGAGYGRTAYVILKKHPKTKYIIVDLPPALYIGQRYLSQVFSNKKIFNFVDFNKFSEIKNKFLNSDITFLMPYQIDKIPEKFVDLTLAIDCLHEMVKKQIEFYFKIINKISNNFYFKCWKKTKIPYDNILLSEKDYPVISSWKKVFWRNCKVQTSYFEAFFSIR